MSLKKVFEFSALKKWGQSMWREESKRQLKRGMLSYAIIWPLGCIVQQKLEGRKEIDYPRLARFCIFGSLYVAPTLTIWMNIARATWPRNNLRSAVTKAVVEQVSYTPFAMTSFYFGMTLLEMKGVEAAKQEVKDKFLPTWKVGAVVWPFVQTLNYTVIAEKNRIVFVSFCSFMWTTFLAYMKQLSGDDIKKDSNIFRLAKQKRES